MNLPRQPVSVICGLIFLVLITGWIYSKGVNGPFVLDDNWNVVSNEHLRMESLDKESLISATFSGNAGVLKRPISMLSFALNYYFSGEGTAGFKWVNIVIHLITGLLIYFFCYWLLEAWRQINRPEKPAVFSSMVALFVSGIWLLHPLNVTSVLYVVQRMTSLSALFTFLGLALYVRGRISFFGNKAKVGSIMIFFGMILCLLLAAFSKENGVLLIFLITLCELLVFRFRMSLENNQISQHLKLLILIYAGLPILGGILLLAFRPESLINYAGRDFTLLERLLSESRILVYYIRQIFVPDISQMGLMHDGFIISRSWFEPMITGPAVIICLLFLLTAFLFIRCVPLLSFGLLFFFIGHGLESTIFPLELVYEHRNYLPMIGLILIMVLLVFKFVKASRGSAGLSLLLIFLATQTSAVVKEWSAIDRYYLSAVRNHPDSPRAHQGAAGLYMMIMRNNDVDQTVFNKKIRDHFLRSYSLNPADGSALFMLARHSWIQQKPVKPEWLQQLAVTYESGITHNKLRNLKSIVECEIDGECHFGKGYMQSILESAKHSATTGEDKITFLMAKYYAAIGEVDLALPFANKSAELFGRDIRRLILYSDLLMKNKQMEKAHQIITEAEQKDKFGLYAAEIAQLIERLADSQ